MSMTCKTCLLIIYRNITKVFKQQKLSTSLALIRTDWYSIAIYSDILQTIASIVKHNQMDKNKYIKYFKI